MFALVRSLVEELRGSTAHGRSRRELVDGIEALARVRSACDAAEAVLAAGISQLDDRGADAATVLRSATKCSEREAKRRSTRAEALSHMPTVADAFVSGRLTAESVDTLVRAAEATSPEIVNADAGLLDIVRDRPADLSARDVKKWTSRHQTVDDREETLRSQVTNRDGVWFTGEGGMTIVHSAFDPITGARIRQRLDEETDRLWRNDGGRDGRPDDTRSPGQRRADALSRILAGVSSHPADESVASPTQGSGPSTSLVIVADIGVIDGTDPGGRCEILDVGPVPPSILQTLSPDTELRAAIFAGPGCPLWLGRSRRLASTDQRLMLSLRDGGCTHCDAPSWQCQCHHTVEWEKRGKTDVDSMTLVCQSGHTAVHSGEIEIEMTRDGPQVRFVDPRGP